MCIRDSHTTLGLVQLFNHGKFLDFRQYPDAKEIFDFINANGGYDLDNKLISEEAIWAMKNNADIWSKLPDWMQPVSYTHLDVYKRQGLPIPSNRRHSGIRYRNRNGKRDIFHFHMWKSQ